jgi:hypothetical protein
MSFAMTRCVRPLVLAALLVGAVAAQGLKVGEKAPDFSFSGVMLNGDGRTDLKEFRGNVLMLDWWGNH